ncbi:MAG: LysR family transcriptional regulator [Burkholderiales bacterium]
MDSPFQAVLRLQLKQLHQLVAITETGSIRAAARRLLIAQPALSRSLRAMESDLGFALFERSARGIAPTHYAEVLVQYARLMDATLQSAAQELRGMQGAADRIARFGIGPYEGYSIAHKAVDRILQKHPDTRVIIHEGGFEELKPKLTNGDIDFIFGPGTREPSASGILDEVLAYLHPLVAVRSGHPLARRKQVSLADLANADWILPQGQHLARARFEDVFLRNGLLPPTPRIEAPTPSPTSVALLLARDLVALLPAELIEQPLRSGQIRALPIEEIGFDVALHLAVRAGCRFSPVCRDLIAELRALCRQLPGRT